MVVGQEHGPRCRIRLAFPERRISHRIDVHVARVLILKQRARLVDDHGIDVKPFAVTDGRLEDVVGFSGYRKNCEHSYV